jgi:putative ABC transport system ATP-binding protein
MGTAVVVEGVTHLYRESEESAGVEALSGVDLHIEPGTFLILMGASGSGKSTLLNLIGAVDRPTSGRLRLGDVETTTLDEHGLTLLRRERIGYVFQFFHLLPTLTVEENISFPLALAKRKSSEIATRVDEVLNAVGLSHRRHHFPNQLSGGEMQRTAIGRAIVHRPELILADEPTGNLDSTTGESILQLLRSVHQSYRPTIVMATHSDHAASFGEKVLHVVDGRISETAATR